MAGELIYPWGTTTKVDFWPCQLKANCFWWASLTGEGEKCFCWGMEPGEHNIGYYVYGNTSCWRKEKSLEKLLLFWGNSVTLPELDLFSSSTFPPHSTQICKEDHSRTSISIKQWMSGYCFSYTLQARWRVNLWWWGWGGGKGSNNEIDQ